MNAIPVGLALLVALFLGIAIGTTTCVTQRLREESMMFPMTAIEPNSCAFTVWIEASSLRTWHVHSIPCGEVK